MHFLTSAQIVKLYFAWYCSDKITTTNIKLFQCIKLCLVAYVNVLRLVAYVNVLCLVACVNVLRLVAYVNVLCLVACVNVLRLHGSVC